MVKRVTHALRPSPEELQHSVLTALRDYIAANGIAPTVRELGELVERSPMAVFRMLTNLEQADFITCVEKDGRRLSRGILLNPGAAEVPRVDYPPIKNYNSSETAA